jgi:hypothetical protein
VGSVEPKGWSHVRERGRAAFAVVGPSVGSLSSLGMSHETLRNWVRQAERDDGRRPGPTSDERDELKRLRSENAELRRANEILKSAAPSRPATGGGTSSAA